MILILIDLNDFIYLKWFFKDSNLFLAKLKLTLKNRNTTL